MKDRQPDQKRGNIAFVVMIGIGLGHWLFDQAGTLWIVDWIGARLVCFGPIKKTINNMEKEKRHSFF